MNLRRRADHVGRAIGFFARHLGRACFVSLSLANAATGFLQFLAPVVWLVLMGLLPWVTPGAVPDGPEDWTAWWTWSRFPYIGTAAGLLMLSFLRSVWNEYRAVESERDDLASRDDARWLTARRRLRGRLAEGQALWKGKGPSDEEERAFVDALQADIEELLVNPTWEELQHRVYDKDAYTRSSQARVKTATRVLGEMIGGLRQGDLRDPESDPNQ